MEGLRIAVSKGRILDETLPLLARVGIAPAGDIGRRLIVDTTAPGVQLIIIRATDVPTYVAYGAADAGIAGKDVLLEHGGEGLYEPLDLGIARCRLMVCGRADVALPTGRLRVATKYLNITQRYYAERGVQVEPIKLYGSMELAPLVGLADCIVDLVDTGNTLRANGLAPLAHIANISSRLVVNRASMKLKQPALEQLIGALEALTRQVADAPA
ncbi:ATP phosphoribosyltransferase [Immundisolibacter cernigliae]|uniref:ATP phosphoribosyltransferase n=1 Tax=Immundisolibacter cernigliae TaxID=1810504 RepID=A0A1B1YRT5_9GAMM|nr:ATP phosphoribosyltransferase [Immundisolibacter cernigliae]ANX03504.1 ATP phosphoribosyltransferase [Immundisolibacter cernigliae]